MAGGRASRQKGDRRERELVAAHKALGIKAERVPLSGAAGGSYSGDIDVYAHGPDAAPLVCEVKARASGEGFTTLERWLGENDAIFLKRDRAEPLVVLPWRTWAEIVAARKEGKYPTLLGPTLLLARIHGLPDAEAKKAIMDDRVAGNISDEQAEILIRELGLKAA